MEPPQIVTDAKGRRITLRKINVLDQVKMLRAIGPKQAENQPYFNIVECAFMADMLDGIPLPMPSTEQQIDAAIGRLGDEGIAAIMVHRIEEMKATTEAAEAAALNAPPAGESSAAGPLPPPG
jgi:hypothetical protein